MNTFRLRIATPDGNLFDGAASMLSLRGAEGDLAIMAGHIPFITSVKPGQCKVVQPDEGDRIGTLEGGLLSVTEEETVLLSGSFQWQ